MERHDIERGSERAPERQRCFLFDKGAIGPLAIAAVAFSAFAAGAGTVGWLTIGRLDLGKLVLSGGKVGKLEIDELTVRRLRVLEDERAV